MSTPNKKLFRNMQEHPEQYTESQLESVMTQLDKEPDVDAAWQEFEAKLSQHTHAGKPTRWYSSMRKIAAVFVGILLVSVTTFATVNIVQRRVAKKAEPVENTVVSEPKSTTKVVPPVHFENTTLDSILAKVASHYHLSVSYNDKAAKSMKFYITWHPSKGISHFIQKMNMFDGLLLSVKQDTIHIEVIEVEEDKL